MSHFLPTAMEGKAKANTMNTGPINVYRMPPVTLAAVLSSLAINMPSLTYSYICARDRTSGKGSFR